MQRGYGSGLFLTNSAGYRLAEIRSAQNVPSYPKSAYNYVASYPADGVMMLAGHTLESDGTTIYEMDYTCTPGAVTLPAPGVTNSATCLTLDAVGTYSMPLSQGGDSCLVIPCSGVLDLDMDVVADLFSLNITVEGSNGTALEHITETARTVGSYASDGNMFVHIAGSTSNRMAPDAFFALAWGCNAAAPVLPAIGGETSAPLTLAPYVFAPTGPCVALEAPLASTYYGRADCYTVQCMGTVHVNATIDDVQYRGVALRLVNANGYKLMELGVDTTKHMVTSFPADGLLTLSLPQYVNVNFQFTFDWTCEAGPVPPPAPGIDSAECLTMAPVGTYNRVLSAPASHCFAMECLGTFSVSVEVRPTGDICHTNVSLYEGHGWQLLFADATYPTGDLRIKANATFAAGGPVIKTNGTYSPQHQGVYQMHVVHTAGGPDDHLFMSWACDATSAPLPSFAPSTAAPETMVPPTTVPIALCTQVSNSFSFRVPPTWQPTTECWYLSCTGTLHVSFDLDLDPIYEEVALENSYGYNLDTLMDGRRYSGNYRTSYPADGNMVVRFASTTRYQTFSPGSFNMTWTCEEAPVLPPAPGTNASECLTLGDSGTYSRSLGSIQSWNTLHCWTMQCYGVLFVAAWLHFYEDWSRVTMVDSTGKEVYSATGPAVPTDRSAVSTNMTADFASSGLFHITVNNKGRWEPGVHFRFEFGWSCNGVLPTDIPAIYTPVPETALPSSMPEVTQAPQTGTLGTQSPLSNAPVTQVPQTEAGETESPLTSTPVTESPLTSTPVTESPLTSTPVTEVPLTNAPDSNALVTEPPRTPAPLTGAPVIRTPVTESPPSARETRSPVSDAPVTKSLPTSAPETTVPVPSTPVTESPPNALETRAPVSDAPVPQTPLTPAPETTVPVTRAPDTAPLTPAPDTPNTANGTPAPLPATGSPATEAPEAPLTSATETPAPTSSAPASSSPSGPHVSAQPVPHTPAPPRGTSLPAGALLPTPVPEVEAGEDDKLLSTAAWVVIAALGTCLLLAVGVAVFFCRHAKKGTPTESFYNTALLPEGLEGEAVCLEDSELLRV